MIAVTGSAGLVGGNLARTLLADGCKVRALVHRQRKALAGLDVEVVEADLTNRDSLIRAFSGVETVYHLGGLISIQMDNWDALAAVNVEGTRNVVEACLECGVRRLVHFSSVHALQQEPLDAPLDESRPFVTRADAPPYERSKAAADLIVREGIERGLDAVLIFPTAIAGPFDFRPSYIGMALRMLAGGRIPALVSGGYNWVDVRDVVAGAIQSERLGAAGSSYILSGHWNTIQEVAQMVSAHTGKPAPRWIIPLWLAQWAEPFMAKLARLNGTGPLYTRAMLNALRSNRLVSHARATRELGYHPRPLRETVADTLQWFAAQEKGQDV